MPELITFDYGSTLVSETYASASEGIKNIYKHLIADPYGVSPEKVCEFFEELERALDKERPATAEIMSSQLVDTAVRFGGWVTGLDSIGTEKLFWEGTVPVLTAKEGIVSLLSYIRERGVKLAVVSNYPLRGETMRLRLTEVLGADMFDAYFTSADCLFRKPSPLFYRSVCGYFGIDPENAMHCGDSYRADVGVANAVGAVGVYYKEGKKAEKDCINIDVWSEFEEMLRKAV